MDQVTLQLLNGLVVGLSLALVASGLALIFGVLDIVNFAQGDFFMLGGYVLWFTVDRTGNFTLGVVLAGLVVGVGCGIGLLLFVWPLLDRAHALVILATLGLSLIVQQEATNFFGGATRLVSAPITAQVSIGGVDYPVYNLVIIVAGAAILAAGYLFLRYAKYGIWIRAVAQNRSMSAALGVPVPRVYVFAFVISAGLAGIAGALLAPIVAVYPTVGNDVILNAFIIVVAGGMGNFRGAAAVAILLGEVQALGSIHMRPVTVQLIALGLVILLLIARSRRQSVLVRL
jgi:branched-subunit amino acid ABC-type transport system permease component